jgi:hypothetical protein
MIVELGTPATLVDDEMGHEDGSVRVESDHHPDGKIVSPDSPQRVRGTKIGLRPDGTKPALTWCFRWWAILGSNQ